MNTRSWHLDVEQRYPEPTLDPCGDPFPGQGNRLIRLQREIEPDIYFYIELQIPKETPVDDELEVALAELDSSFPDLTVA